MSKETISQELREELREKIEQYLARREEHTLPGLMKRTGISHTILVKFLLGKICLEPQQKQSVMEALNLAPAAVLDITTLRARLHEHIARKGEFTVDGLATKAGVNRMTISQIRNNDKSLSHGSTITWVVKALGLPQEEEEYLVERLTGLRRRATEQNAAVRAPRELESEPLPYISPTLQQKMSAMREEAAQRSIQPAEEESHEWWQ